MAILLGEPQFNPMQQLSLVMLLYNAIYEFSGHVVFSFVMTPCLSSPIQWVVYNKLKYLIITIIAMTVNIYRISLCATHCFLTYLVLTSTPQSIIMSILWIRKQRDRNTKWFLQFMQVKELGLESKQLTWERLLIFCIISCNKIWRLSRKRYLSPL